MASVKWAILGDDGLPKDKTSEFPPVLKGTERASFKIRIDAGKVKLAKEHKEDELIRSKQGGCEAVAIHDWNNNATSEYWDVLAWGDNIEGIKEVSDRVLKVLGISWVTA